MVNNIGNKSKKGISTRVFPIKYWLIVYILYLMSWRTIVSSLGTFYVIIAILSYLHDYNTPFSEIKN